MATNKKSGNEVSIKRRAESTGKYVDVRKTGTGIHLSGAVRMGDQTFTAARIMTAGQIREFKVGDIMAQGSLGEKPLIQKLQIIDIEFYQPLYANSIALLNNSKKGLAASAAIDFINLSGFTHMEFQATFQTTVKTIQNYATKQLKLDSVLSEKLLKAFALFEKGIGVFGSPQAFHDWLNQPAYGLGNQKPYDLMDTITGITLIEEELIRLEYGDLA